MMTPSQKAVIDQAKKEGKLPSEVTGEFLLHDLVQACIGQLSKHEVGFRKLTEKQQDSAISELTSNLKESALLAARIIASAGTPTVQGTLKKIAIDTKSTLTVLVDGSEKHFNDLISATQDKSDILIILYERDYFDALDNIQSEKDQKTLPLDSTETPKKPKGAKATAEKKIELTPKMITDARDFVTIQKNASIAGLQNFLHVGFDKAEALLKLFEGEGLVKFVGTDKSGQYEIVRASTGAAGSGTKLDPELYGELTYSEVQQTVVLHATAFELPWLAKRFGIDEERAKHLALQLLEDDVIGVLKPGVSDEEVLYEVIAKLEDLTI